VSMLLVVVVVFMTHHAGVAAEEEMVDVLARQCSSVCHYPHPCVSLPPALTLSPTVPPDTGNNNLTA